MVSDVLSCEETTPLSEHAITLADVCPGIEFVAYSPYDKVRGRGRFISGPRDTEKGRTAQVQYSDGSIHETDLADLGICTYPDKGVILSVPLISNRWNPWNYAVLAEDERLLPETLSPHPCYTSTGKEPMPMYDGYVC